MTFDPVTMIQQLVKADFQTLLEAVTGTEAQQCTAYQMERYLFRQLLELGAGLMQAYLVMRSATYQRQEWYTEAGERLPYHGERSRQLLTIFGQLEIKRPYFYHPEHGGQSPLDSALGLDRNSCYSDLVREWHEELATYLPYGTVSELLERFVGLDLSKRVIQEFIEEDAVDVEAYYEQKDPPSLHEEGEILVLQADGKGVPIVRSSQTSDKVRLRRGEARSRKKQVVVTSLYTIPAAPRTAADVLRTLLKASTDGAPTSSPSRHRPHHKQLWGTLAGKAVALDRLAGQVAKRDGDHIQARLMLCDGDKSLQSNLLQRFPDFSLILDFIHAYEYLWQAANGFYGDEHPDRLPWVQEQTRRLLTNQVDIVIDELRQLAEKSGRSKTKQTRLLKIANYLESNQPYMAYARYLAQGWPIASGVIEGACRHFVKDRLELSGMRWLQRGAENLLRLRAVTENDDWVDYHRFRKQRRQKRHYGCDWPKPISLPPITSSRRKGCMSLQQIRGERRTTNEHTGPYVELPLAH